jgi:hypothetical protein
MEFRDENLTNAQFAGTNLRSAHFRNVDLSGASFRDVSLSHSVFHGVELDHVTITGAIDDVTINGVDVVPLIEAELNRRDPDRPKIRPTTAVGFREAWIIIERRWDATVDRARCLPPGSLHVRVDNEWSFIETLRHLVFATDSWVRRAILGDPAPWDPLGLPWDQMPDTAGVPRDRTARPTLDVVLALRRDRMAGVRTFVDHLTDEQVNQETVPVHAPGWPPPGPFTIGQCLRVILNEEWEHRQFAERDLALIPISE